jgi:hypothetical protein
MKKIDGVKSQRRTTKGELREKIPLCCIVNPRYLCTACNSKVCVECNVDFANSVQDNELKLHFTGHLKKKCLRIRNDTIFRTWIFYEQPAAA